MPALGLAFVFAVIVVLSGVYYYGEQWFVELEEKAQREERGE